MSQNSTVLDHLIELNKTTLNFNDIILKLSGKNVIPLIGMSHSLEFLHLLNDAIPAMINEVNRQKHGEMKPQSLNNLLKEVLEEKLQAHPPTAQTQKLKGNGYPHLITQFGDYHIFLSLTASNIRSTDAFRSLYIYPPSSEDGFRVQADGIHLRLKFDYELNASNEIVLLTWEIADLHGCELTSKIEFNASNSTCFDPTRVVFHS